MLDRSKTKFNFVYFWPIAACLFLLFQHKTKVCPPSFSQIDVPSTFALLSCPLKWNIGLAVSAAFNAWWKIKMQFFHSSCLTPLEIKPVWQTNDRDPFFKCAQKLSFDCSKPIWLVVHEPSGINVGSQTATKASSIFAFASVSLPHFHSLIFTCFMTKHGTVWSQKSRTCEILLHCALSGSGKTSASGRTPTGSAWSMGRGSPEAGAPHKAPAIQAIRRFFRRAAFHCC